MAFAILVAVAIGTALILMTARYSNAPAVLRMGLRERGRHVMGRPEIAPERLVEIVSELLEAMGLRVVETTSLGRPGATRMVAIGQGALRSSRHIIYAEATPPGQQVDGPLLLELAADVTHGEVAVGVLVTPYAIDQSGMAGMTADLELIDGAALLALVEHHLPERAAEMTGYHLGDDGDGPFEPPTRVAGVAEARP